MMHGTCKKEKTLSLGFETMYTCGNIQDAKTLGWNGKRKMKSYPGREA
jgi:hypothetical protein